MVATVRRLGLISRYDAQQVFIYKLNILKF